MKWLARLVGLVALGALLWWGWWTFFPSDERRVTKLLNQIAATVSVPADGKFVGGVLAADRLQSYFTPQVEVAVEVPGEARFNLTGREELAQAYLLARSQYRGLTVEFFDMQVALAPGHETAVADLTARARRATGEIHVQELRMNLVRHEGEWRVQRVETTRSIRY